MLRELRAIHIDFPERSQRIRLSTCGLDGEDYETILYTGQTPLNRGRINSFLHDYYKGESSPIKWPKWLKIPEV